MRAAYFVLLTLLVVRCRASGKCPSDKIRVSQTSTAGDVACPDGTFLKGTYRCEPYIDGKEQCNPREECTRRCNRWCTVFCCFDDCKTVYDMCDKTVYRTCSDCLICVDTKAPTKRPTKRPTRRPTTFPTRAPTKSPVPTPEPTFSPSRSPTLYPTNYPTRSPTLFPTTAPTQSPVPPTTPIPSMSPIPTPEPTPPTFSPTLLPTTSPTEATFFSGDNIAIFAAIFGVGGGASIAAFVIIYKRRKSGVDTEVAEELLEWKEKHRSRQMPAESLMNPMYGVVSTEETIAVGQSDGPGANRLSLRGVNVHAWLQEVKDEEKLRKEKAEKAHAPKTRPPREEILKMKMKYDFIAQNEDELSAKKGEVLYCLDIKDDWFVASNPVTGESGLIPRSYVRQFLDEAEF